MQHKNKFHKGFWDFFCQQSRLCVDKKPCFHCGKLDHRIEADFWTAVVDPLEQTISMISSSFSCSCCVWTKHTENRGFLCYTLPTGQGPLLNYTVLLFSSSNKAPSEQPLKGMEGFGRKASIRQSSRAGELGNLKPLFRFNTNLPEESHMK